MVARAGQNHASCVGMTRNERNGIRRVSLVRNNGREQVGGRMAGLGA